MEAPTPIQVNLGGYGVIALTHLNTWLYSYTVDPHCNFILIEGDEQFFRVFNSSELYDQLFRLDHNIVSEFEPTEAIRQAFEQTMTTNTQEVIAGLEYILGE